MFTPEQIKVAHEGVKSGADFPAFIQELKKMGVISYNTFVEDGHTNYFGTDDYQTSTPAKYGKLSISNISNIEQFKIDLKAHQEEKTDYQTFCNDCAKAGLEKWVVSLQEMSCTYFDKVGNSVLAESIL